MPTAFKFLAFGLADVFQQCAEPFGHDEGNKNQLRAIEFPRIKGGKEFDVKAKWFSALLKDIGQPKGKKLDVKH